MYVSKPCKRRVCPPKVPIGKKLQFVTLPCYNLKKNIDKMYILFIKSVLFRKFSVKAYLSECFGVSDHLSATKFILASSEQSITWLSVWNLSQNVLIILQQVPFIEIKYESNLIALYISKFRVLLNHLDIACSSINMSLLSTAGDLHITREKTNVNWSYSTNTISNFKN